MSAVALSELANASEHPYLQALNAPQKQAVLNTEGPLLVLAGAGTGKTRVLTTRIAHLLHERRAQPYQILAVTFTNKASMEMRERISHVLGRSIDGMWVGTFHSIAVRILRRHAEYVGLSSNFTILDTDDQLRLIKQLIKAAHLDEKQYTPRSVSTAINKLKDRGIKPDRADGVEDATIITIYRDYQERLRILNAADFADLLMHNLTLFQEHPEILAHYQQQFKYILVDEYQDTNSTQYVWLRLLAKGHANICCVGDDDQSIYGWRGAEVGNILRFEQDFPGANVIRLEQNYRSTAPILAAASGLIAHNRARYGKTLWTDIRDGDPVRVRGVYSSDEEVSVIGEEIEHRQRKGALLSSMAILVRASFQTREFEEGFMRMGIPYRVIGGLRFYERQEIRDAMAYVRFLVQPDDGLAFERVINLPKRGIGDTTLQRLHQYARAHHISLPRAARHVADGLVPEITLRGAARTALCAFFTQIDQWRDALTHDSHDTVVKRMLDESGYTYIWMQEKTPDAATRIENLKEFVHALTQFDTLGGFLEHVSLVLDTNNPNTDDMVTLMTLHAAKGLEFDSVFLTGWEEGLFPHPRALYESDGTGIEEERRLAYVGISRARSHAMITYSYRRRQPQGWQNAMPSRFIRELPQDVIVHQNPGGFDVDINQDSYTHIRPPYANTIDDVTPTSFTSKGRGQQQSQRYAHAYESTYFDQRQHYQKKETYTPAMAAAQRALSPRTAQSTAKRESITHAFKTGERVHHATFGYGTVVAFEGDKLMIEFQDGSIKKIMASFVDSI